MSISRREFLDFLKATCAVADLRPSLMSSAPAQQLMSASAPTADSSEAITASLQRNRLRLVTRSSRSFSRSS
jgi:hypothetical protein